MRQVFFLPRNDVTRLPTISILRPKAVLNEPSKRFDTRLKPLCSATSRQAGRLSLHLRYFAAEAPLAFLWSTAPTKPAQLVRSILLRSSE